MRDLEVDLRDLKVAKYFKERAGLRADTEKIAIKAIERAIKAEAEVERLQEVASIAWNVVETKGLSDVLLHELAGRLADWETWKEGER